MCLSHNRSQAEAVRKWKTLILGLKEFSIYLGETRHTQKYWIFYPLSLHFPPLYARVKSSSLEAMWPWASYLPFLDLSLFISKMGIRLVPPSSYWFEGQRRCLKGFAQCLNALWSSAWVRREGDLFIHPLLLCRSCFSLCADTGVQLLEMSGWVPALPLLLVLWPRAICSHLPCFSRLVHTVLW